MNRRIELHKILCSILSCPEAGNECRVYFQPPASVKMRYPAIVYELNDIEKENADNGCYLFSYQYSVTLIDKNPDSESIDKIAQLPLCTYNRHFVSDNLNHDVFQIFY